MLLKLKEKYSIEEIAKKTKIPYNKITNKLYHSGLREKVIELDKKDKLKVQSLKREGHTIPQIIKLTKLSKGKIIGILYNDNKKKKLHRTRNGR